MQMIGTLKGKTNHLGREPNLISTNTAQLGTIRVATREIHNYIIIICNYASRMHYPYYKTFMHTQYAYNA